FVAAAMLVVAGVVAAAAADRADHGGAAEADQHVVEAGEVGGRIAIGQRTDRGIRADAGGVVVGRRIAADVVDRHRRTGPVVDDVHRPVDFDFVVVVL